TVGLRRRTLSARRTAPRATSTPPATLRLVRSVLTATAISRQPRMTRSSPPSFLTPSMAASAACPAMNTSPVLNGRIVADSTKPSRALFEVRHWFVRAPRPASDAVQEQLGELLGDATDLLSEAR